MKGRSSERGPSTTLLGKNKTSFFLEFGNQYLTKFLALTETSNNTGGWRNHYVNGVPFTIGIATLGLILVAAVLLSATMIVSGHIVVF
jgi:hypothetical protein